MTDDPQVGRWWRELRTGEPIVCPAGHKLRHNCALLQHEVFICQHRAARGQGECGRRVYVLLQPGGGKFVAEVSPAEMLAMRDGRMNPAQVEVFLKAA